MTCYQQAKHATQTLNKLNGKTHSMADNVPQTQTTHEQIHFVHVWSHGKFVRTIISQ
jgi:hypothetical protein